MFDAHIEVWLVFYAWIIIWGLIIASVFLPH